mmetsp:Transcript_34764/g.85548  ORF Transcript_34764/g.85548 Transcript_34764/m.85548 type:complete len:222 (+) Transcript_34764:719-1384(+)
MRPSGARCGTSRPYKPGRGISMRPSWPTKRRLACFELRSGGSTPMLGLRCTAWLACCTGWGGMLRRWRCTARPSPSAGSSLAGSRRGLGRTSWWRRRATRRLSCSARRAGSRRRSRALERCCTSGARSSETSTLSWPWPSTASATCTTKPGSCQGHCSFTKRRFESAEKCSGRVTWPSLRPYTTWRWCYGSRGGTRRRSRGTKRRCGSRENTLGARTPTSP